MPSLIWICVKLVPRHPFEEWVAYGPQLKLFPQNILINWHTGEQVPLTPGENKKLFAGGKLLKFFLKKPSFEVVSIFNYFNKYLLSFDKKVREKLAVNKSYAEKIFAELLESLIFKMCTACEGDPQLSLS